MSGLGPVPAVGRAPWLPARLRLGRPRFITVVLVLLVVLAPPTYLAQTSGALTTGYNIQRLQAERNAWRMRNQQLELELAKARSLAWVEAEAVNRLGMQKPTQQTAIAIDHPPPSAASGVGHPVRARPSPDGRSAPRPGAEPTERPEPAAAGGAWLNGLRALLTSLVLGE